MRLSRKKAAVSDRAHRRFRGLSVSPAGTSIRAFSKCQTPSFFWYGPVGEQPNRARSAVNMMAFRSIAVFPHAICAA